LNDQFYRANPLINFDIPIYGTAGQIGWSTPYFDPLSASIFWDANTGLDLANFGVNVQPAPTPEPGSLTLLGSGLIGVAAALRRKLASGRLG